MIWPTQIATFRDNHLRSNEHIAILRIAELEAFILENWRIEPDAQHVPPAIKAFAFLSLI